MYFIAFCGNKLFFLHILKLPVIESLRRLRAAHYLLWPLVWSLSDLDVTVSHYLDNGIIIW